MYLFIYVFPLFLKAFELVEKRTEYKVSECDFFSSYCNILEYPNVSHGQH